MSNGFDDLPDFAVVASDAGFEFFKSAGEFAVVVEQVAELDKGAHDGDVDADGALAAQDAGEHGDALFGKDEDFGGVLDARTYHNL